MCQTKKECERVCSTRKQRETHKDYRHSPAKQTHQRKKNATVNQISSIFKNKKSDQSECTKILGKWRRRDRAWVEAVCINYYGNQRIFDIIKNQKIRV